MRSAMQSFQSYLPEDPYSILMMGVVALIAIWLVMFVVRKLIGIALVTAIIIGGLLMWQNPAVLQTAQDTVSSTYHRWR